MLRDVKTTVTDGLLEISTDKGTGVHIKIGASPMVSQNPIIILGNMTANKIKQRLGFSPLADAIMDSVENGSNRILCIPVAASNAGTVGQVTVSSGSHGSCTVSGTPYNAFHVVIEITAAGALNEAAFRYSIDGGYSYSDELTIPLTGVYQLANTGLTVTLGLSSGNTAFVLGETYSFVTTAPEMTNQDVLSAIAKIRTVSEEAEFVHIVGESTKALWAAVSAEQKVLAETYHKPMFFMMEACKPNTAELVEDYAFRMEAERKLIKNYDIQVVAARSLYTRMDGVTTEINNAGIVAGLYSKTKVQESIGKTRSYGISPLKMLELRPAGIEDYIETLDLAGYLTFRQYDGLDGFFVTNARMLCPDESDYRYAEDVRVKNKLIRVTRKAALLLLQEDVDMSDMQGDLEAKAKFIQSPADDMVDAKEISSVAITVPENQNILVDETMHVIIRYVPIGKIREIEIDLGMRNPMAA